MNDEDAELLHTITEEYYRDFTKLVQASIDKIPADKRDDLQWELLLRIQDKTSVYSA